MGLPELTLALRMGSTSTTATEPVRSCLREVVYPTTTTSLSALISAVRATSTTDCPFTGTSRAVNPMKEKTRVALGSVTGSE
jgi:hypothetical protein